MLITELFLSAAPTYTQLGGGRVGMAQAGYPHSSAVWPQWQPSSDSASHSTQQSSTSSQAQAQQGGQQGQEEFSDMLRMLDNSGTEFSDLSGMFNTFTE